MVSDEGRAPGRARSSCFGLFQGAVVLRAISTVSRAISSVNTIKTAMNILRLRFGSAIPQNISLNCLGDSYLTKVPVLPDTSAQFRSSNSIIAILPFSIDPTSERVRYSAK